MGKLLERHPFSGKNADLQCEIPGSLEHREEVIERLARRIEALNHTWHSFWDQLALDEAISNAIIHGNRENPQVDISLRLFCKKGMWAVEIIDCGNGFECPKLKQQIEERDILSSSGRGMELILSSGADIHFANGGRQVVVLRKKHSYPEDRERIAKSKSIIKFIGAVEKCIGQKNWVTRDKVRRRLRVTERTARRYVQLALQAELIAICGRGPRQQISLLGT